MDSIIAGMCYKNVEDLLMIIGFSLIFSDTMVITKF